MQPDCCHCGHDMHRMSMRLACAGGCPSTRPPRLPWQASRAGAAGLSAKYSNTVTQLFKAAVSAKFTAVRLFLHGEDEASQLQTQPGQHVSW